MLNIAIIGCGRIAQAHAFALQTSLDARLCAVCDADEKTARAFSHLHGVPVAALNDLLRNPPDAAIVCVPPVFHRELTTRLLQAGVHVLCEKPLATTLADAQLMAQVADESGRALMMASKFRFCDGVMKARELLQHDELGEVRRAEVFFCAPVDMKNRWNSDPQISGGGVLMDNGPHAFDILHFLLGPLEGLRAEFSPPLQKLPVEDGARVDFQTQNGARGEVVLNWSFPASSDTFLHIQGRRKSLSCAWNETRLDSARIANGYDKDLAFARQLAHFAACARGHADAVPALNDALSGARAIEAVYRSARDGAWHDFERV